jgi:hypothetical protein
MTIIKSVAVCGLFATVGCGGERLWPLDSTVTAPEGVKIAADSQGVGSFSLRVTNDTAQAVVIDRDAVTLKTVKGEKKRLMDKGSPTYEIPAGMSQMVNVKYNTRDLDDNEVVTLIFDGAVKENNQPVAVPPMRYETRDQSGPYGF